jgi:hypothetical protein
MKVEISANVLKRHVAAHSTTARCLDCDDRPARLARPSSAGASVGRGFSTTLIRHAYSGETELVRSRAQLDLAMTFAKAPGWARRLDAGRRKRRTAMVRRAKGRATGKRGGVVPIAPQLGGRHRRSSGGDYDRNSSGVAGSNGRRNRYCARRHTYWNRKAVTAPSIPCCTSAKAGRIEIGSGSLAPGTAVVARAGPQANARQSATRPPKHR